METKDIIFIILDIIVIILLIIMIAKEKSKEKYCVDISGGFKAPCDCQGDCVFNK